MIPPDVTDEIERGNPWNYGGVYTVRNNTVDILVPWLNAFSFQPGWCHPEPKKLGESNLLVGERAVDINIV